MRDIAASLAGTSEVEVPWVCDNLMGLLGLPDFGCSTVAVLMSRMQMLPEPEQFTFCGNLLGQIKALLGGEEPAPLRRRARRLPAYLRRVK